MFAARSARAQAIAGDAGARMAGGRGIESNYAIDRAWCCVHSGAAGSSPPTESQSGHPPVVVAAVVVAAIFLYRWLAARNAPLVYSGTVETREIEIGSKIGGRVTGVAVEEGQMVSAGAPLVSFEADQLKAERAQAEATVEQGAADLNRLHTGNRPEEIAQADAALHERAAELQEAKNGPRPEDLRQAQADYDAAKADAVNAAATYTRMQPLVEKDVISRQQFDGYTAQRDSTAQRAESARQKLVELQAGTRTEDIQAAEGRYQQALAADTLSHQGFRPQDIASGQGRLSGSAGAGGGTGCATARGEPERTRRWSD